MNSEGLDDTTPREEPMEEGDNARTASGSTPPEPLAAQPARPLKPDAASEVVSQRSRRTPEEIAAEPEHFYNAHRRWSTPGIGGETHLQRQMNRSNEAQESARQLLRRSELRRAEFRCRTAMALRPDRTPGGDPMSSEPLPLLGEIHLAQERNQEALDVFLENDGRLAPSQKAT